MLKKDINDFPFHMFRSDFWSLWLKDCVLIILCHLNLVIWTADLSEYCFSSEVR